MWGGHAWPACGARAYNGIWGGAPAGSMGRASGQGVREAKPPEAENLLAFGAQRKQQICFILCILQTPYPNPNPLLQSKNSPDLYQSQERPLAKVEWSGHVHPVATPLRLGLNERVSRV